MIRASVGCSRAVWNHSDEALKRSSAGKGGRPAHDAVLMFKVLVLQALFNLSDEQTEYQILDRLSFMKFLGLELCDDVPDARTIWLFRETLRKRVIKMSQVVAPSL